MLTNVMKRDIRDPWDPFASLFDTVKSLGSSPLWHVSTQPLALSATHRCEERDNVLVISIDVPGVKPGDINVSVEGQALVVSYKLRGVDLSQPYTIMDDYDASGCTARLEHGVLELRMPKLEKPRGKKIAIEVK